MGEKPNEYLKLVDDEASVVVAHQSRLEEFRDKVCNVVLPVVSL